MRPACRLAPTLIGARADREDPATDTVSGRARACGKRKAPTLVGASPTGNKAQPEARAALAARANRESPAHLLASVVLQPNDFKVRGRWRRIRVPWSAGKRKAPFLNRAPRRSGTPPIRSSGVRVLGRPDARADRETPDPLGLSLGRVHAYRMFRDSPLCGGAGLCGVRRVCLAGVSRRGWGLVLVTAGYPRRARV